MWPGRYSPAAPLPVVCCWVNILMTWLCKKIDHTHTQPPLPMQSIVVIACVICSLVYVPLLPYERMYSKPYQLAQAQVQEAAMQLQPYTWCCGTTSTTVVTTKKGGARLERHGDSAKDCQLCKANSKTFCLKDSPGWCPLTQKIFHTFL